MTGNIFILTLKLFVLGMVAAFYMPINFEVLNGASHAGSRGRLELGMQTEKPPVKYDGKRITLGAVAALLIITGMLFHTYRIKRKCQRNLDASLSQLDEVNVLMEALTAEQEKLIREKEWLVKEVQHRVKNNLQIVTGLLYSQSVYLEDDAAKVAIKDSLRRMQAMSLIHQKLYQDENTSTIAMREYIDDLVDYLRDSFEAGNRINFKLSVETLGLDISQAIPLGLIITESIVNAIKYAFLNAHNGTVTISLQSDAQDWLQLKIFDNGIGLPKGFDTIDHSSLGLELMIGLTKQLKGTFRLEDKNGVHITVRFRNMIKKD
jgi:two-component system, sensor histidine kinase PdtaS